MEARLTGGILGQCYENVRRHFYESIDADVHAQTYAQTHDLKYAEPEFTGKFLDICACYYAREQDSCALEKGMTVVRSIAAHQREDGYLGCLEAGNELEAFSVWNHGFTLYGLTRFYEATKDETVLALAVKAADWLAEVFRTPDKPDILNATNDGSQHISALYAMGRMYAITGNERYAHFLRSVLEYCEKTRMNLLSFDSILNLMSRKGIEMLVVYLGVLQYGLMMNQPEAVEAAKRYWRQVHETQIRNTGNGTIREVWTENGNAARLMPTEDKPNETCVAVGWMELSLALFHQEQRAEYLDALEQTLYNHLVGSLSREGDDLAYYQGNYGRKVFRTAGGMYQCCRYRGYTIVSYLPQYLWHFDGEILTPMIYAPSSFRADGLTVQLETQYPSQGSVCIAVDAERPNQKLRLRIPAWCRRWTVQLNGIPAAVQMEDGWMLLALETGYSEVLLEMEMPVRREFHTIEGKLHASFQCGPLLLSRVAHSEEALWQPVGAAALLQRKENGEALAHFTAEGAEFKDFASAGMDGEELYTVFVRVNTHAASC